MVANNKRPNPAHFRRRSRPGPHRALRESWGRREANLRGAVLTGGGFRGLLREWGPGVRSRGDPRMTAIKPASSSDNRYQHAVDDAGWHEPSLERAFADTWQARCLSIRRTSPPAALTLVLALGVS